jgi:tRNA nucleotidyltransferase (CCA-adding enzyme)
MNWADDPLLCGLRAYLVGGAVRDRLLGLPVSDCDYVVVGSAPAEMEARGFRPVGQDFPVFLHPVTHAEFALARTERKSAPGYKGFVVHASPGVSLEEDLQRRDLTINAMAETAEGRLVDPFGGQRDLAARCLRHVSPVFVEDPLRILRVARFAARFVEFQVAPETVALMRDMVAAGEVDHLVAERVWQELARGLMEAQPSRMFAVLRDCGALARLLPEVDRLFGVPQPVAAHPEVDTGDHVMRVIDYAARQGFALPVRFAALVHDLGKGTTPPELWPRHPGHEARSAELVVALAGRLRVPGDCRDLAVLVARHHGDAGRAPRLTADERVSLLESLDAFRRPSRLEPFLQACACDFYGRPGYEALPFLAADTLRQALRAAQSVDAGALIASLPDRSQIPASLHRARTDAVAAASA